MEVKERNNKEERQILIGFITNNQFLSRMVPKWEKELFRSHWSNLVAGWCIKFYTKYKKAPKADIEGEFDKWCRKAKDEKTQKLVESFLSSLSREYDSLGDSINVDLLVDRAANYFNRVRFDRLQQDLETAIEEGDVAECENLVRKHRNVEMGEEESINPYTDAQVHREALESRGEPLLRLGGDVGKFFGDQLTRENFIAFQAPEKGGKSLWLQEVCHRGAMNALRVAFFGIGDMSKNQTIGRYQARLARRPIRRQRYRYPISLVRTDLQSDIVLPKTQKRRAVKAITIGEIEQARKKFVRNLIPTDEDLFKMICKPSMSVDEIRSRLQRWQDQDSWSPDIIAVDYADLLTSNIKDKLERIDSNWQQLRQLALEYHCLVLTATQVKRTAYNKLQDLGDTADQKTKAAHVTGLIGINFRKEEYERDTRTLNWIVCRDGATHKVVHVAGCYAISNPCILSTF